MTYRITLEAFADPDGDMPPERVARLLQDAEQHQGPPSAPLEYIEPIGGGNPRPWGLRVVMMDDE